VDRFDVVKAAADARHQAEVGLSAPDNLLLTEWQPRAGKLAPEQRDVPLIRVPRRDCPQRLQVDPRGRDHVAAEDHRLQVETATGRQHARDAGEQVAVDLLLTSRLEGLRGAEMLKRTEARDGVEHAEALSVDLARVLEVDLEPVPAAGRQLCRRERHAHRDASARSGIGYQRPPATTQVEQASARPDSHLFGDIVVLAALGLLEAEREIPVEHRAAEIRQLTEAEPDDPVGQRVGEVGIPAVRHPPPTYASRSAEVRSRVSRGRVGVGAAELVSALPSWLLVPWSMWRLFAQPVKAPSPRPCSISVAM